MSCRFSSTQKARRGEKDKRKVVEGTHLASVLRGVVGLTRTIDVTNMTVVLMLVVLLLMMLMVLEGMLLLVLLLLVVMVVHETQWVRIMVAVQKHTGRVIVAGVRDGGVLEEPALSHLFAVVKLLFQFRVGRGDGRQEVLEERATSMEELVCRLR